MHAHLKFFTSYFHSIGMLLRLLLMHSALLVQHKMGRGQVICTHLDMCVEFRLFHARFVSAEPSILRPSFVWRVRLVRASEMVLCILGTFRFSQSEVIFSQNVSDTQVWNSTEWLSRVHKRHT